jgi:60 kDa SS-A/Ro ribonucleoprotein
MPRYNVAKKKSNKKSLRLWATRNSGIRKPIIINKSGRKAFSTTSHYQIASMICTSFSEDKFYESNEQQSERLRELISQDPYFAAQSAVFARQVLGLRSISHFVLAEVTAIVKGATWTKEAVTAGIRRPDDITETLAAYMSQYGKPIPNSLRKGLKESFGKFNGYQLAKYRGDKNLISLLNAVNLLHPSPTDKNREAIAQLKNGTLKNEETWEAMLSAAGNDPAAKSMAWTSLLVDGNLPYMALLKNLRNIAHQAPDALGLALKKLTNKESIKRSLVLPFRFVTAYNQIENDSSLELHIRKDILDAISVAVDSSTVQNLDRLPGNTLIVFDTSSSMNQIQKGLPGSSSKPNPDRTAANIGAFFAAALLKANPNADLVTFASSATQQTVARFESVMQINNRVRRMIHGGGTNIGAAFDVAPDKKYDSIIILSDGEHNWDPKSPNVKLEALKKRTGSNPKIFNFDLAGYGTLQFPQENVYTLFGFSDRILALINYMIEDKEALLNAIRAVNFKDNAVREEA